MPPLDMPSSVAIGAIAFARVFTGDLNITTCANIATLQALNTTQRGAYVDSVRDWYVFRDPCTRPTDGITVVAPNSGGTGKWERLNIPHPSWLLQSVWEIDSAIGSDEAGGAGTGAAALKTWGELERRLGLMKTARIDSGITINVKGDLPLTDPMRGKVHNHTTYFTVKARLPAASWTGVVTAKEDIDITNGSGLCNTVTSTWTPASWISTDADAYIVKDATNNRYAWIAKDLGGGKARLSPWVSLANETGGQASAFTPGTTTVGATLEIYRLPRVHRLAFHNEAGQRGFYATTFNFFNFDTGSATIGRVYSIGSALYLQQCRLRVILGGGQIYINNSCIAEGAWASEAPLFLVYNAGVVTGSLAVNLAQFAHTTIDLQGYVLFQGTVATVGRGAYLRLRSAFFEDCTTPCIQVEPQGSATLSSTLIFGNGNTDAIVQLKHGNLNIQAGTLAAQIRAATSAPVPLKFGTSTTAPAYDPATGIYTAPRNLTWANIDATVAAGGFGGAVLCPITGNFAGKAF